MQEVKPQAALALLRRLQASASNLDKAYKSMGILRRWLYLVRRFPLRDEAQAILNDTVDYLSDSRNRNVIRNVNRFPFQLTVRNVGETLQATSALIDLFEKEADAVSSTDEAPAPAQP